MEKLYLRTKKMTFNVKYKLADIKISDLLVILFIAYRPQDYCYGEIIKNGEVVAKVEGSYLGWVKIDG